LWDTHNLNKLVWGGVYKENQILVARDCKPVVEKPEVRKRETVGGVERASKQGNIVTNSE